MGTECALKIFNEKISGGKKDFKLAELLDKSKEYIAAITAILTFLLIFKNTISFMSSTEFERQFFSKEKKFLFETANYFLIFILFPTMSSYALLKEFESIKSFANSIFFSLNVSAFIILLTYLGISKFITVILKKKNKNYRFFKNKIFTTTRRIGNVILTIATFFLYGLINANLLLDFNNNYIKLTLILILSVFELFLIYVIFKGIIDIKFTKPILVDIKLDNSQTYNEYFIYYPNGKFILIGKPESIDDCKEPILINIDKIVSCKQITEKSSLFLLR
ncbi:hypothetical protein [uncultured Rummeliibacillus sp.]|uniref:hypothetical protein n=1 Tax=uncultured Rummeliibacillus sp. TaxID=762292 RepID=UPI0026197EA7|nr:hypothetical protein [uncultured Rummeliibacillus sp.]